MYVVQFLSQEKILSAPTPLSSGNWIWTWLWSHSYTFKSTDFKGATQLIYWDQYETLQISGFWSKMNALHLYNSVEKEVTVLSINWRSLCLCPLCRFSCSGWGMEKTIFTCCVALLCVFVLYYHFPCKFSRCLMNWYQLWTSKLSTKQQARSEQATSGHVRYTVKFQPLIHRQRSLENKILQDSHLHFKWSKS